MRNRGSLYFGLLLILLGGVFLLAQVGGVFLEPLGLHLGWADIWPFLILFVALAFWLPILIWWDRRANLAGLAIPGTIIGVNGLLLLYQNTTGDWGSWAYLWALEPISVGLGLLMLYLLGHRQQGLLVAAGILIGVGAVFFVVFSSIFVGWIRFLAPVVLILVGILAIMRGVRERSAEDGPQP